MAQTPAQADGATSAPERTKRGFFATIVQFFREVFSELKKVVTPTRKELINYTLVVLGFVITMMLLVTVLDFAFGKLSAFVFGGAALWPLW
ncbi:preprotein translocase subunit SecE [Brevibacterium sp. 5221]|uniref:Protein translocase subunit SecE n=1 Tax=Brevibacterium rongguiense TaxID=2695267 RepID=A0A6N9H3H2_9MICO|nr:preprotein translocase subunit SecE [Brevibacterium rongguiense]MYM18485.1 preprotein translocase subunit SecE [Brevibacterium rongguiense]